MTRPFHASTVTSSNDFGVAVIRSDRRGLFEQRVRAGYLVFLHPDTEVPDWVWGLEPVMHQNRHLVVGDLYAIDPDVFRPVLGLSGRRP